MLVAARRFPGLGSTTVPLARARLVRTLTQTDPRALVALVRCRTMSAAADPTPADEAIAIPSDTGSAAKLQAVLERIKSATEQRDAAHTHPVQLVAVSKTKPVAQILEVHAGGQRVFGENYVQELVEKARDIRASAEQMKDTNAKEPLSIEFHFIGTLQSNKVNQVVKGVLADQKPDDENPASKFSLVVETVTSEKLAKALNKVMSTTDAAGEGTVPLSEQPALCVYVQINSSGEETKNGVTEQGVLPLCRFIVEECPRLKLCGLMTIGAPDYSGCRTEDFELMRKLKEQVDSEISGLGGLGLSMGMSADFETAVREGSSSVRVGSSIFGAREYTGSKKKD